MCSAPPPEPLGKGERKGQTKKPHFFSPLCLNSLNSPPPHTPHTKIKIKGCTFEVIAYATDRAALPIASWTDADPGRAGGGAGGGCGWLGAYSDDSVCGDGCGSGGSSEDGSPGASPLHQDGAAAARHAPRRSGGGGPFGGGGAAGAARGALSSILPLKSASAGGGALSLQVFVEGGGEGGGGGGGSRPGSPVSG